jgi:hypothetical protein
MATTCAATPDTWLAASRGKIDVRMTRCNHLHRFNAETLQIT